MVAYTELFSSFLRRNQIKLNEPMSRHTTFGIGGAADCFVMPETIEELQKVIVEVTKANVPFFILGGGANLLVRDKGIRGVVIYTGRLQSIIHEGNRLRVAAGCFYGKGCQGGNGAWPFRDGICRRYSRNYRWSGVHECWCV